MKYETIHSGLETDLSAKYRPIALAAVKAAVVVVAAGKQAETKTDFRDRLLLPENLPEP